MSNLVAKIVDIQSSDSLHIVKFDAYGQTLSMMSLDLDKNMSVGTKVELSIAPSHVAIGKDFSGDISYSNRLEVRVASCENGVLLTSLKLELFDAYLEAIITAESSKRMDLKVGDRVMALIKASEVSIAGVRND